MQERRAHQTFNVETLNERDKITRPSPKKISTIKIKEYRVQRSTSENNLNSTHKQTVKTLKR